MLSNQPEAHRGEAQTQAHALQALHKAQDRADKAQINVDQAQN
jgi:hypothetical protein